MAVWINKLAALADIYLNEFSSDYFVPIASSKLPYVQSNFIHGRSLRDDNESVTSRSCKFIWKLGRSFSCNYKYYEIHFAFGLGLSSQYCRNNKFISSCMYCVAIKPMISKLNSVSIS